MIKNGKLFGALNLLDIFIIFAVIGLGVLAYFFVFAEDPDTTRGRVRYTVEIQNVDPGFYRLIRNGDIIRDAVRGFYLGEVDHAYEEPHFTINWDNIAREYIRYAMPERATVFVVIECDAVITPTSIFTGDMQLQVGRQIDIKGRGYAGSGHIVHIMELAPIEAAAPGQGAD